MMNHLIAITVAQEQLRVGVAQLVAAVVWVHHKMVVEADVTIHVRIVAPMVVKERPNHPLVPIVALLAAVVAKKAARLLVRILLNLPLARDVAIVAIRLVRKIVITPAVQDAVLHVRVIVPLLAQKDVMFLV